MKRQSELALVCHCVLNQNSVVHPLARNRGAMADVVGGLLRRGCGIYQLPCPELLACGLQRLPQSYPDYDRPDYRELCNELAERTVAELAAFVADGCKIRLLVGIGGSPTCAISGQRGHFMEALLPRLQQLAAQLEWVEVPQDYEETPDEPRWLCAALNN